MTDRTDLADRTAGDQAVAGREVERSRTPRTRGVLGPARALPVLGAVALLAALLPGAARAQDAVFQSYFFDVCSGAGSPTGALAIRCGETPGGAGDLSADSEASLDPSQFVSSNEGAILRARARQRALHGRMEAIRDEAADPARAAPGTVPIGDGAARASVLVNGRWSTFERDASADERALDGDVWSAQIGGDYRVAEGAVLGALFGYDRLDSEFEADAPGNNFVPFGREGTIDADAYTLVVFGSFQAPDSGLYADLSAGVGLADYRIERTVVFQETNRTVPTTPVRTSARPDGLELQAAGTLGYDFSFGAASLGPYARLVYVWTELDSFTERSPSGLAMEVDRQSRDSLASVLGARASYAVSLPLGVLVPQVRAEWEHEYAREAQVAHTSFALDAAGRELRVRGESPDRNYANLGASLVWVLPGGWLPFADYQALVGYRDLERHAVTVGLRKEL